MTSNLPSTRAIVAAPATTVPGSAAAWSRGGQVERLSQRHGGPTVDATEQTDNRLTAVHAHSDGKALLVVELRDHVCHFECSGQCVVGVVVVSLWPPEAEEHAISAVPLDVAAELPHDRYRVLLVELDELAEFLGVHGGREFGRPHEVAKDSGDVAKFAAEL